MKKLLSILMSVVLMATMCVTAFAAYENTPTTSEISQREIENMADSQYIATQGMVLLENNGVLPISDRIGTKIALYGVGVKNTIRGGTGSGSTNPRSVATVYDAFKDAGYTIVDESESYLDEVDVRFSSGGQGGIWGGGGVYNSADVIITDEWISDDTDTAIYVIPRQSGEGSDRTATEGNYYLSETEYANLTKVAGSYENVIVVFNIGGIIDMKWFDEINAEIPDGLDAVLIMSQAGQQGGPALVQIMNGEVTPSGKLTDTWAINYEDYPSSATFSSNDGDTVNEIYEESIYNGYRYFDTFGLDVAYPFGYGLSYTDFDIEVIDVNADSRSARL